MPRGLQRLRRRVHRLLRVGSESTASRALNTFLAVLILASVAAVVLETVSGLAQRYGALLHAFEVFTVAVFTVEYLARLWTAPEEPGFGHPLFGRLKWALTPLAVVDLVAILPFYLPMVVAIDLRVLRVLRLLRILRILKLARYSKALQTMGRVFRRQRYELTMTLLVVGMLLVLAASLMYYAEHEAQPEVFGSIPETMWWAVVTLTTVGYGDVVPVTPLGRVLGAVIAILGIGMIALPAGILGSGFVAELQRARDEAGEGPLICPHCGRDVHAPPDGVDQP